jgi:hypothetical protein
MKRTQSINSAPVNTMAAPMLPEDQSPLPDRMKVFPAPCTTPVWATAVWGSKPARKTSKPPGLADRWESSPMRTLNARVKRPWTSSFHIATTICSSGSIMMALYGQKWGAPGSVRAG